MKKAGVTYDPATIEFRVFQQDDGQWRVEVDRDAGCRRPYAPPPGRQKRVKMDARVETTNLKPPP